MSQKKPSMTLITIEDFTKELELVADDPEKRLIITGVSWQQYEALLAKLGDSPCYGVTYLEGVLEIMSPSRRHEYNKKNIGRLLEAYFEETRTKFWGLGSTTFRLQEARGGTEPDECYCLETNKELPDLAIEVVLTSGGIDKLTVYKRLGIKEVWFWQNDKFEIYCLRGKEYEKINQSQLLPQLNLTLLAEYVIKSDPLEAVLEFREKIRRSVISYP